MQEDLKSKIAPFFLVEHETSASICLEVGDYKVDLFELRADDGFEGNGYDWESLATVFLKEQVPHLVDIVDFDSEASMFCAYSSNKDALIEFILKFKDACENKELIEDLFSRAELD